MKKLLLIILFIISLASTVYSIPVAEWHFDECNGTTVSDATGNGNNGNFVGNPTWTTDAISGCALHFDGINDYISIPSSPTLLPQNEIKLEAWVKRDSNADGSIISKNGPYYLGIVNNKIDGRLYINGWHFVSGTTNLLLDQWYHLAMTYNGSEIKLFVNGVEDVSAAVNGSIANIGSILTIGWGEPGVNFFFNGTIDEVLIDNSSTTPTTVGTVGYWKFDEGYGNLAYDSSGFNNTGTLQNGASWTNNSISGYAIQFDGVNDHISVTNSPSLNITGNLTIQVWVYLEETPTSCCPAIVSKWDSVLNINQRSYAIVVTTDRKLIFRVSPNGQDLGLGVGTVFGNSQIVLNEWTHVTGNYDGFNMKIYINGLLDNSTSYNQGIFPGNIDVGIGGLIGGGSVIGPFKGIIDEVRIDNKTIDFNQSTPPPNLLLPIGNKTITEGQTLNIQLQTTSPSNTTTLTFGTNAYDVLPSSFNFNPNTGLFLWIPTFTDYGNYSVTFNVTNGIFTDNETMTISVLDANTAVLSAFGNPMPGGNINFIIADPVAPYQLYILALSTSNSSVIQLSDGRFIPLEGNGVFVASVFYPGVLGLSGSTGFLNPIGNAMATWTIPNIPLLSGQKAYAAFVTINPSIQVPQGIISISNAVEVDIE